MAGKSTSHVQELSVHYYICWVATTITLAGTFLDWRTRLPPFPTRAHSVLPLVRVPLMLARASILSNGTPKHAIRASGFQSHSVQYRPF
jgi:hypothetical protein